MSKSVVFRVFAVMSAAALTLGPRLVWACLPNGPGIESTVPENMETHPANAGVAIIGSELFPTSLSATVDGNPATVTVDQALSSIDYFGDYRVMVVRTAPTPEPGQVVHVFGEACQPGQCEPLDLEYVAGAPDLEAPEGPAWVSFDTFDHGSDPPVLCDCPEYGTGRYALSVRSLIIKPDDEMVLHFLGVRPVGDPDAAATEVQKSWDKWVYGQINWYEPAPVQAPFCALARTIDLAGNESETLEECDICRDQVGDGGGCEFVCEIFPCGEPNYACESIVNQAACPASVLEECEIDATTGGGTTGDGSTGSGTMGDGTSSGGVTSTTGGPDMTTAGTSSGGSGGSGGADTTTGTGGSEGPGGDDDKSGCACDSGGSGSSWVALLGLLVLAGPRRRRR